MFYIEFLIPGYIIYGVSIAMQIDPGCYFKQNDFNNFGCGWHLFGIWKYSVLLIQDYSFTKIFHYLEFSAHKIRNVGEF